MKGQIQFGIGRPQGGRHDEKEVISMEFMDCDSRMRFLIVNVPLAEFAKALTGQHGIAGDAEFYRLDVVGKTRVRESREAFCPGKNMSREQLADWLLKNCADPGWEIDTYLGSQGSVTSTDGGYALRYSAMKYVPRADEPA